MPDPVPEDYAVLAQFRRGLRRFLRFSEQVNARYGSTPALYQLMLVIKAHRGAQPPDIGMAATALGLRHHSAAELVQRAEAAGFVGRAGDDNDARRSLLSLTEHGERTLAELVRLHTEQLVVTRAETFFVLARLQPAVSGPGASPSV